MQKEDQFDTNEISPPILKRVFDLLEDFNAIASPFDVVLVPNYNTDYPLIENVHAALVATSMRLSSIDYAKKKYCQTDTENKKLLTKTLDSKYIDAYKSAKSHINQLISRLTNSKARPIPSSGVFGASLVLERLPSSFFSAHLLYCLGQRYEAHAVSRLILEQIAWANTAYKLKKMSDIKKIITTKTITDLKKSIPESGVIYGYLSKKTHLDYESHSDFLHHDGSKNYIKQTQYNFHEYAQIILYLADIFGIVWELSQFEYMEKVESIYFEKNIPKVLKDRPFKKLINKHLKEIKNGR